MRRADARRNASMMISSSIRWSFTGEEVDWITNTSAPRTFSWISTKISMSAKRRTTALLSGMARWAAMASASARLELPATSLIAPLLARIAISVRRRAPARERDNKPLIVRQYRRTAVVLGFLVVVSRSARSR